MSATALKRETGHGFRASTLLLAFPHVFRESFRAVPAAYYLVRDKRALIECPCGRRPIIDFGDLRTCSQARAYLPKPQGCSRAYFHGLRLHVAS